MFAPSVRRAVSFPAGFLVPLLAIACVSASPEQPAVDVARPGSTVVEAVMASQAAARRDRPQQERWGDRYWGTSAEPATRFEPIAAKSAGVLAHEWSGEGSTRTDAFDVRSEWRLVWRSGHRPIEQPLEIVAYRADSDELVVRVSVDGQTPTSSLHLHGEGSYYLTIDGKGGGWYVAVEIPSRE